ncbi:MAG TPA: winged helix-turn-helix domain-containing protein [Terriglobales bacterium]|nr:winged helix-turn-helix domain-containing protein [Terriglobales bacterium]
MTSWVHRSELISGSNLRRIAFDRFELDLRSLELRKDGRRIRLQAQPFRLLALLVEQAGEVVTREEVCRTLWQTDTFVDFDHGVAAAVNKIREALGDCPEKPRFIETLPKVGYRFIGQIKRDLPLPEVAPRPGAQVAKWPAKRLQIIGEIGIVVVALLCTLGWKMVRDRNLTFGRLPQIRSLAVLPLANLSGEADQDYFADGMTEALITDLGKIGSLRVISRTSVMQYKGTKKPLPEIARDLNVDAIIEGTVSRSGNHLRITANLLQASPEKHLWAESYDSEAGDALTVEGQLARAVAHKIQVTLTPKERNLLATPRPVDPEAQDLYFRGGYVVKQGTEEAQKKAIRYFQRAIEKDPGYAAPYAALGTVYALWMPGENSPRERMPKAREFALKALSLDNGVLYAHYALGAIALFYDWDWTTAENEFQRELELNPNHVLTHESIARALVTRGKTEEAVAEAKRARRLSPAVADWDYSVWIFILARRYDLARELAQEEVDLEPNFPWGHFNLAQVYEQDGRAEDGAREFLRADELLGTDPKELEKLNRAMAKDGAKGYWNRKVENYRESAKSGYVPPVLTAMACIRIGDKQCVFEWLEKGFQERDDLMIHLKVEPVFDGLREDPRFQALVHRVGIP